MLRSLATRRFSGNGWLGLIAIAMAGVIVIAGPLLAQNAPAEAKSDKMDPPAAKAEPSATPAAPTPVKVPSVLAARQHIEAQLKSKTQMNFTDTPLQEAMQFLGSLHNFKVIFESNQLQEAAIALDSPLTTTLDEITLESALNILLKPLHLTYLIEDEVLKITTKDAADERFETRVYDVKGLAAAGIQAKTVCDAIQATIPEGQWSETSGEGGTIFVVADGLIVKQTQPTHREIERLLDQLERLAKLRAGSNPPPKGQATVPTY